MVEDQRLMSRGQFLRRAILFGLGGGSAVSLVSLSDPSPSPSDAAFHHAILSSQHSDSLPASPVQGDLVRANATPAWERLPISSVGSSTIGRYLRKTTAGTSQDYFSGMDGGFIRQNTEGVADVNVGNVSAQVLNASYAANAGLFVKVLPICIFEFEWTALAGGNPTLTLTLKAATGNPPVDPATTQRSREWRTTASEGSLWDDALQVFKFQPYTKAFIVNPHDFGTRAFWTLSVNDPNSYRVTVDAIGSVAGANCIVRFRNLQWYDLRGPV